MSSNFGQMGPLTMELAALEHLKNWCRHIFLVAFLAHSDCWHYGVNWPWKNNCSLTWKLFKIFWWLYLMALRWAIVALWLLVFSSGDVLISNISYNNFVYESHQTHKTLLLYKRMVSLSWQPCVLPLTCKQSIKSRNLIFYFIFLFTWFTCT